MHQDTLLQVDTPCFYRLVCSPSDLTNLAWALSDCVVVRVLRGHKMRTESAVYNEIAAALQFPHYFGENWDALSECLTDLEWLEGAGYVLLIAAAARVLEAETDAQRTTFLTVLERAHEEWGRAVMQGEAWDRPPRPFHVILHCEPTDCELFGRLFPHVKDEIIWP